MTYYKATKPDGTSFQDSTTRWEVGEITLLPEGQRGNVLCHPGLLHASTESGESLVIGSWPCRLFLLEPVGEVITNPGHSYKVGAHAWLVKEEIEGWKVFGPNGFQVARLIERCSTLTKEEAQKLFAAVDAARVAAVDVARVAAWYTAVDVARNAAVDVARYAAVDVARNAAVDAARNAAWYAARNAAVDAARNAAWYAALSLVTWDLATEDGPYTVEMRDLLYRPWKEVMGE